ncbi:cytokine-like nuclear factor N-PAC [Euwallacea similis]|uniref:cytokine-like nuclear factor N-PAC n=1 Tax=Euwallacea similis TaxID=1736056 RepID=UPI00344C2607
MVFKENEFVWAKMPTYSHWPGIVMAPNPEAPPKTVKDMQWIYFLGTHNYGWVEDKNIKPYEEFKRQYKKKNTEAAVVEVEEIIASLANDPDFKIPFAKYVSNRPSPKKARKSSGGSVKSGEKKRIFPLKENTPVPHKKARSSGSRDTKERLFRASPELANSLENSLEGDITLNTVNLGTSSKFFGVLAGSVSAEGLIKNLIKSGHRLYIWSRSSSLCEDLQQYADKQQTFFKVCNTPRQVIRNANITFSCLSDPDQAKAIINQLGIADKNDDLLRGKGYVEMTSIDPETSKDFHELISKKEGLYLEAMLQGCKPEAINGEIIVLAAGLQSLFVDCQSCFKAIGKASFLLGKIGSATKIHMIFQMMRGIFLASLVEGFVMADRSSIKLDAFNNIFKMTHMSSEYLRSKSDAIVNKKFLSSQDTEEPIEQLQRDIAQGLQMSNHFKQPMPLASNTNDIFKHARRLGCDGQDSACIYRTRY